MGQERRIGPVCNISALPQGLRAELPTILAKRSDVLSPRMLRIVEDLSSDWRRLDEHIERVSSEIAVLADQDAACKRLMSVPEASALAQDIWDGADDDGDWAKVRNFIESVCNFCGVMPLRLPPTRDSGNDGATAD
jgi:hypothetical protein